MKPPYIKEEFEQKIPLTPKQELVRQLARVVGYVPSGTGNLLNVLIHPDVISFTKAYIKDAEEHDA